MQNNKRRCGFVALVGRPNVGKSTLFNRLVGAHLSPVTHKPQTSRYNIRGVFTQNHLQIIFVDTPGLHHRGRHILNKILNKNALRALHDVDVVVAMAVSNRWLPEDESVLEAIRICEKPAFLVLNKVDRINNKSDLLGILSTARDRHDFKEIFPLSALRDTDFDQLIKSLEKYLPERNFIFENDQLSDRSERFIVAELIREKLMIELNQELPYATHIEIEKFEEKNQITHISAIIFVEKVNQRAIVIGHQGNRLKRVGTCARSGIENFLGQHVFLQLWVKTKSTWQHDSSIVNAYSSDGEIL